MSAHQRESCGTIRDHKRSRENRRRLRTREQAAHPTDRAGRESELSVALFDAIHTTLSFQEFGVGGFATLFVLGGSGLAQRFERS